MPAVIRQREDFIHTLRPNQTKRKAIYYTDETWANKFVVVYWSWNDGDRRARLDEPVGKGGRIINAQFGSCETGLLVKAGLSLVGKESTGDDHKEINGPT